MSSTVLTCNIKHNGCFHTTPVSSPAFTPYHRDLQTTFPGRRRESRALLVSVGTMNDFLQLQPDTLSVCVSESGTSELSSLPNHISSTGTVHWWPVNTHEGHTNTHRLCAYTYVCMCTLCAQVHSCGLQTTRTLSMKPMSIMHNKHI